MMKPKGHNPPNVGHGSFTPVLSCPFYIWSLCNLGHPGSALNFSSSSM